MITKFKIFESKLITTKDKFKSYYTLYHSTDSNFFREPEQNRRERYYNPLGTGMYFSSFKNYSKKFGKNTYIYYLPKNSKILFINKKNYKDIITDIIRKLISELELNWNDVVSEWNLVKIMYININETPIGILNGLTIFLYKSFGLNESDLQSTIENITDEMNSEYDAIWYSNDLYNGKQDEIIIPFKKFNKENFKPS